MTSDGKRNETGAFSFSQFGELKKVGVFLK